MKEAPVSRIAESFKSGVLAVHCNRVHGTSHEPIRLVFWMATRMIGSNLVGTRALKVTSPSSLWSTRWGILYEVIAAGMSPWARKASIGVITFCVDKPWLDWTKLINPSMVLLKIKACKFETSGLDKSLLWEVKGFKIRSSKPIVWAPSSPSRHPDTKPMACVTLTFLLVPTKVELELLPRDWCCPQVDMKNGWHCHQTIDSGNWHLPIGQVYSFKKAHCLDPTQKSADPESIITCKFAGGVPIWSCAISYQASHR